MQREQAAQPSSIARGVARRVAASAYLLLVLRRLRACCREDARLRRALPARRLEAWQRRPALTRGRERRRCVRRRGRRRGHLWRGQPRRS